MAHKLHIDIETFSELDLKKVGAHRYFEHPSTTVLCACWALGDEPVRSWDIRQGGSFETALFAFLSTRNVDVDAAEFHAWNAGGFEALRLRSIPPRRWRDTMVRAAYYGLPMSLDQAGQALGLQLQKDMAGRRLMLKMSRPDKTGRKWHETDPALLDQLVAYCKTDVEVERDIGRNLPALPDSEQELWRVDHHMMQTGLPVDLQAVRALRAAANSALAALNLRLQTVTGGRVSSINAVGALLSWCHGEMLALRVPPAEVAGVLPDLTRASVEGALSQTRWKLGPFVSEALSIRREAAKSSIAKLDAMDNCACADHRIRGLTQFYGAGRTGRWAGRLVQVHNLPRGVKGLDATAVIADVVRGLQPRLPPGATLLDAISGSLRACFAGDFGVGDFSQIEARGIAWLAGQRDILNVFARGEDVYVHEAAKQGSTDRQFGKVLVLACGFGMGGGRFLEIAATYGLTLTAQEAQDAVNKWRAGNQAIVRFWRSMEHAARLVLEGRVAVAHAGKVKFGMGRNLLSGCLLMQLPSGRLLVYRNARLIAPKEEGWPDQIAYDGVDQKTRKWGTQTTYGGKLAENATQAIARDLLAHAVLDARSSSLISPLVTVHDEIICADMSGGGAGRARLERAMTKALPPWANGLPVAAEVKILRRYGK